MIKYLGSKRLLLTTISDIIGTIPDVHSVIDLFSGTSRVGHHLKSLGYCVHSNDLNQYAYALATCYVAADKEKYQTKIERLLNEMSKVPSKEGYFTETFCRQSMFFQPHNGMRVDAMRDWIEEKNFDWTTKAILLVSLMEAADRVDSTCGQQMAFLKKYAKRSFQNLELRMPELVGSSAFGVSTARCSDARDAAKVLQADVAYLDPPYNQHKYRSNYHIWDTLVRWDKPEAYGVARKRVDVRTHQSVFNRKREILEAMQDVVDSLQTRYLVVSFNNEGYISKDDMVRLLSKKGKVVVYENEYKRYVGAQIGIHNPEGKKVGNVSHLKNKEYIFVVGDDLSFLR